MRICDRWTRCCARRAWGPRPERVTAERRAATHLDRIARTPRPAGGAAEEAARRYSADVLATLGFSVEDEPFAYSEFVGRWGTPVLGALALAIFLAACMGGSARLATLLLAGGGAAIALAGVLLARRGVISWPTHRRGGVNLVARRGGPDEARIWLVAHLDSKSQPVPILLRAAGIVVFAIAWITALALAWLGGGAGGGAWTVAAVVGTAGAVPVILTTVGSDSPGALDNASGVATVLLAAELAPTAVPLGVLLTSAEELGLAGARAWAVAHEPGRAVNVDGVDDAGALVVMRHGARSRGLAESLARAGDSDDPVRVRGLIPGVLTDGVALADTGWAVVTVSQGGVATLARIHTRRDTLSTLAGTGVARTAALIARALPELA